MKILNIKVSIIGGKIVLTLDQFVTDHATGILSISSNNAFTKCFSRLVASKNTAVKNLNIEVRRDDFLYYIDDRDGNKRVGHVKSIAITLPAEPCLALAFIEAVNEFISEESFTTLMLHNEDIFAHHCSRDLDSDYQKIPGRTLLLKKTLPEILRYHLLDDHSNFWRNLITHILSITNPPTDYQPALCLLKRVTEVPWLTIDINARLQTLLGVGQASFRIINFVKNLVNQKQYVLLDQLIFDLNNVAIMDVCIRDSSAVGLVIRTAEFRLRQDGRLSISLACNQVYQNTWGPGKPDHPHFKPLVNFVLEKDYQLQLAKDTDYIHELIFTPESTNKLLEAGVHLNLKYVKELAKCHGAGIEFRLFNYVKETKPPFDVWNIIHSHMASQEIHLHPRDRAAWLRDGWDGGHTPQAKPK